MINSAITVSNKVILVTGSLGQIGREISKSFLLQGAKVIVSDVVLESANDFRNELIECGLTDDLFLFLKLDITDEENCQRAVDEVLIKFGRIDVLINNAAIDAKFDQKNSSKIDNTRFENYPLNLLTESVNVNLIGTIIITQVVCRQMLNQKFGNIINVASTYSIVSPNQGLYDFGDGNVSFKPVDYVASKSFIPNFTRYLATFYARNGIRCNAILPHGIYNNHSEEFLLNWEKLSPIGRMCKSDELNGAFTFLASDSSSYMTGAVLSIDGGWTAW